MLRTLIVEDEFISRKVLQTLMAAFGESDVATDGEEALQAFIAAHKKHEPYHLICLDIGMPGLDGHAVLAAIRQIEHGLDIKGVDRARVIITTASKERQDISMAFETECDAYLVKPIEKAQLSKHLKVLGLIDRLVE